MTPTAPEPVDTRRGPGARVRQALAAGWGAVIGVAPHVLHHVGPLAGAAILAGTGGQLLFFVIGLVAAAPMLWRLQRRFHSWAAPAIAAALFAVAFMISSVVLGPLISGGESADSAPSVTTTHGHDH